MEELNIVYKPIKELKPYKKNAKKHSKEQMKLFGFDFGEYVEEEEKSIQ